MIKMHFKPFLPAKLTLFELPDFVFLANLPVLFEEPEKESVYLLPFSILYLDNENRVLCSVLLITAFDITSSFNTKL